MRNPRLCPEDHLTDQFFDSDDELDGRWRGAGLFLTGLGLGVVLGAAVTVLYAPESGKTTRRRLRRRLRALRDDAADQWQNVTRSARREFHRRLRQRV